MRLYLFIISIIICQVSFAQQNLTLEHWEINNGLPSNQIEALTQDSVGFIYLKSQNKYFRFDGTSSSANNKYKRFFKSNKTVNSRSSKLNIYQFAQSANNDFWGASDEGLVKFNPEENVFKPIYKNRLLPIRSCTAVTVAKNGHVWFAMPLNGIGFYDPEKDKIFTITNIRSFSDFSNGYNIFSQLMDIQISHLFFDRNDNLWVGTQNKGLFKIHFSEQRFQFFRFEYAQRGGLAHKDISFPLVVKNENIWISTWGGGINIWNKADLNKKNPEFDQIKMQFASAAPRQLLIFPIAEDQHENIWIGIGTEGLYYLNHKNRKRNRYIFEKIALPEHDDNFNRVWALKPGISDDLWVATLKGLVHISAQKVVRDQFDELKNPTLFQGKELTSILLNDEDLWIASKENGIFKWNLLTNQVNHFTSTLDIDLNQMFGITEVNNQIWFAGKKGLIYCDKKTLKFTTFSKNQLLPSQTIESLLADDFNNLWLGTSRGLAKVVPALSKVVTYNLPGGVLGNNFTQGASKDNNGYLYFGTRYGFYRIHPQKMDKKDSSSRIILKQISISGINKDPDSLSMKKLELPYRQNNIRFEYLDLNYSSENPDGFQVKLEGIDKQWQTTFDTQRSYNLLPPGVYQFKVRKTDHSGIETFQFEILSPWWQTWQAIVFFTFVFLSFLTVIIVISNKRIKKKEKQRQKEYYEQLRFRFFLNISHEIRTPLTLIKGAIDRLSPEKQPSEKELNRIKRNTNRLIRMVNEVLNLKQLEQNKININVRNFNLSDFLESTIDAFRLLDGKSSVTLNLLDHPVWISSSRELIETILYNLLSNAIKYSPKKAEVEVTLVQLSSSIKIEVSDQGIGISEDDQQKIFDRFYQVKSKDGAGIGLSLVKELTSVLGGEISVFSELNKGSKFTVELPISDEKETASINSPQKNVSNLPVLIIADDQAELRLFIREIFQHKFWCIEAENGKVAWELIQKNDPAFIISDVVMPKMTGIELCSKVRSNLATSHIPLIFLTGKNDADTQMQAIECNADGFVTKPFNEHILKRKVEKLLEQRLLLQQKYANLPVEEEETSSLSLIDQEFMDKIEKLINEHLDDTQFGVEQLASEVALSSSGLYRKIKSITGYTPVEFIRLFRLKVAADLLKKSTLTIGEIADRTGFGTQKYFSRCFKNQFDISPSVYRKS